MARGGSTRNRMRVVVVGRSKPRRWRRSRTRAAALGVDAERTHPLDASLRPAPGEPSCVVVEIGAHTLSDDVATVRRMAERGFATLAVGGADARLDRGVVRTLLGAGACDVLAPPLHKRELILRLSAALHKKLRVACVGGGTGLFTVLSALKGVPRIHLSSIVAMSDDGGSSGLLRTHFGVLPPGDVRRSLVALSNAPEVMNYVMQYRFAQGGELTGHSLGNLLLAALAELSGSMQGAVKALGDVLNVQGLVMCVTERATELSAEFEDGRVVHGESAIDRCLERPSGLRIRRVWHEPPPETSLDVYTSLLGADLIVMGPGDLYTSVLAGLIVGGVGEAIRASPGKRLYVCNLMTKPGETGDYDAADHVAPIVDALGQDVLDYVLVSCTPLEVDAVRTYAAQGQFPVATSDRAAKRLSELTRAEILYADVGHHAQLVRHDSTKLSGEIVRLIARTRPSVLANANSTRPDHLPSA